MLAANPYSLTAGKRQDDYELWFRLRNINARFLNLDKILVKYRYTYENWSRNDMRVSLDRAKVLFKYEGIGVFTLAVALYLLLRSCLTYKWVFLLDKKVKNRL